MADFIEMKVAPTAQTENEVYKAAAQPSSGFDRFSREEKYHLFGWSMFVLCSIFYIIAAIEGESLTSLIGGLLFFFACFVFLIPLIWKEKQY